MIATTSVLLLLVTGLGPAEGSAAEVTGPERDVVQSLASTGQAVLDVVQRPAHGTRIVLGGPGPSDRPELLVDVAVFSTEAAAQARFDAWIGNVARHLQPTRTASGQLAATAGLQVERRGTTVVVLNRVSGSADVPAVGRQVWDAIQTSD